MVDLRYHELIKQKEKEERTQEIQSFGIINERVSIFMSEFPQKNMLEAAL